MSSVNERIQADMQFLEAVKRRFSGTEGEREMLHAVRTRLANPEDACVEGFVSPVRPEGVLGIHVGLLFVFGLLGFWWPVWGCVGTSLVTLSLLSETTGRFSTCRWLMKKVASYNLVIKQQGSVSVGAVVVTTPLDVPGWRPIQAGWLKLTKRPLQWVFGSAIVLTALMLLRSLGEPLGPRTRDLHLVALVILALTVLIGVIAYRRDGAGEDSGAGAALLLEITRRLKEKPLPDGVDFWAAFLGCSYAFQGGMRHFLTLHKKTLTDPVLVISVSDPDRTPLGALASEGPIVRQIHRPAGPALVERLQWTGVQLPTRHHYGVSNAREALGLGYRSVALAGGDGDKGVDATAHAADIVEVLIRWYARDVVNVQSDLPALRELTEELPSSPDAPPIQTKHHGNGE